MTVNDYLNLPYNIIVKKINDESGTYYHSLVLELDGCQSTGDTYDEAYSGILEAMEGYIETKLEHSLPVPLPVGAEEFSGKFVVRIPKSLHQKLSLEATQEGVSLNQYALYKLSR